MPSTLLLDRTTWDLVLDANGNIAVAAEPYALAQDAASAIRLFAGELWFDTSQGVPYFAQVLGDFATPLSLVRSYLEAAALTVPGVVKARCFISTYSRATRVLTGQVQVENAAGVASSAGF